MLNSWKQEEPNICWDALAPKMIIFSLKIAAFYFLVEKDSASDILIAKLTIYIQTIKPIKFFALFVLDINKSDLAQKLFVFSAPQNEASG